MARGPKGSSSKRKREQEDATAEGSREEAMMGADAATQKSLYDMCENIRIHCTSRHLARLCAGGARRTALSNDHEVGLAVIYVYFGCVSMKVSAEFMLFLTSWSLFLVSVDKKATSSEIKKAYHRLALACHPDKHPDEPEVSVLVKCENFRSLDPGRCGSMTAMPLLGSFCMSALRLVSSSSSIRQLSMKEDKRGHCRLTSFLLSIEFETS